MSVDHMLHKNINRAYMNYEFISSKYDINITLQSFGKKVHWPQLASYNKI